MPQFSIRGASPRLRVSYFHFSELLQILYIYDACYSPHFRLFDRPCHCPGAGQILWCTNAAATAS